MAPGAPGTLVDHTAGSRSLPGGAGRLAPSAAGTLAEAYGGFLGGLAAGCWSLPGGAWRWLLLGS